jgi:hypothetical protein
MHQISDRAWGWFHRDACVANSQVSCSHSAIYRRAYAIWIRRWLMHAWLGGGLREKHRGMQTMPWEPETPVRLARGTRVGMAPAQSGTYGLAYVYCTHMVLCGHMEMKMHIWWVLTRDEEIRGDFFPGGVRASSFRTRFMSVSVHLRLGQGLPSGPM